MKVTVKNIQGVRALVYRYDCCDDMSFEFHLLSEVGQPWQDEAERMAQDRADREGCTIEQMQLNADPWFVDALVKKA